MKTNQTGATLKQIALDHFLRVVEEYRRARKHLEETGEGKRDFILLSFAVHAAKGGVHKSYHRLIRL